MRFSLTQRGDIVAQTWVVRFPIPPGYRNFGHPQGPIGFDARFVLRAPPGRYVLHGFSLRHVTLAAGRITRVHVREGNCWQSGP